MVSAMESPEISSVCGADLNWYYKNGVLVITGTGEMTNYSRRREDYLWYDIRDQIGWVILDLKRNISP